MVDEEVLAEAAGIFAGDGTLYKTTGGFVLEVRGGRNEENYYHIVSSHFSKLFNCKMNIIKRNYNGGFCYGIRKCGKQMYELFHDELGFPLGKKETTVDVPAQIKVHTNEKVKIAYIRGVFDTDGSVYLRNNGHGSKQPVIEFRSKSSSHLNSINEMLSQIGFNCWIEKSGKLRCAGWSTTRRFFERVRPNNLKHMKRYDSMLGSPSG